MKRPVFYPYGPARGSNNALRHTYPPPKPYSPLPISSTVHTNEIEPKSQRNLVHPIAFHVTMNLFLFLADCMLHAACCMTTGEGHTARRGTAQRQKAFEGFLASSFRSSSDPIRIGRLARDRDQRSLYPPEWRTPTSSF